SPILEDSPGPVNAASDRSIVCIHATRIVTSTGRAPIGTATVRDPSHLGLTIPAPEAGWTASRCHFGLPESEFVRDNPYRNHRLENGVPSREVPYSLMVGWRNGGAPRRSRTEEHREDDGHAASQRRAEPKPENSAGSGVTTSCGKNRETE